MYVHQSADMQLVLLKNILTYLLTVGSEAETSKNLPRDVSRPRQCLETIQLWLLQLLGFPREAYLQFSDLDNAELYSCEYMESDVTWIDEEIVM